MGSLNTEVYYRISNAYDNLTLYMIHNILSSSIVNYPVNYCNISCPYTQSQR